MGRLGEWEEMDLAGWGGPHVPILLQPRVHTLTCVVQRIHEVGGGDPQTHI